MRVVIVLVLAVILSSCSVKKESFYLLNGAKEIQSSISYEGSLGVAKIELPEYLKSDKLAIKLSPNHIVFRDERWIDAFGEMLRERLIKFLKNSLHTQKVYKYPWKLDRVPQKVLKITVNEFIYDKSKGSVVLDADYNIGSKSAHFYKVLESGSDSEAIVEKMNRLFGELEREIVKFLDAL